MIRSFSRAGRQLTESFVRTERTPFLQVVKSGIASLLAWLACILVFPDALPIFGIIAALICVQDNVSQSLNKSIERLVGVVVGVAIAVSASIFFGKAPWLFVAAIFVSLLIGWAFRLTGPSTTQIAISAMLVIALGGESLAYGAERIIETAIGGAIGVLVNAFLIAPVRTSPASIAVHELVEHTAQSLDRIATSLTKKQSFDEMQDLLMAARDLREERREVHTLLRSARESLKLNPRSRHYREQLLADDELFQRLQHIVTQVLGMSRALADGYDPDIINDPAVEGLADEFNRAAHDLRHVGYRFNLESDEVIEPPALTAPYRIVVPNAEHWVLIGALMEDLRRTRISIVELQQGE
ncbi:FUSC family protein [Leucobacter sp. UCMA 4100]|uniref:FUSC family protein n=1 Tax=Leucobacter sp. UCMA 4100 TaxID=2810534 RepID=UPI0022EB98C0|nr:FUSC family protein [Leucobacter sp. UCMA 4100]MDA3145941.1 FUSC family protein [Leucobacter sp. UCMA 4100]